MDFEGNEGVLSTNLITDFESLQESHKLLLKVRLLSDRKQKKSEKDSFSPSNISCSDT